MIHDLERLSQDFFYEKISVSAATNSHHNRIIISFFFFFF